MTWKSPNGPDAGNLIAWLEIEDIAGSDAGSAVLARRRRGDAHIEAQIAFGLRVAGERVVIAATAMRIARDQIEDMLVPPNGGERLGNVKIAEADRFVCRNVELQIVARGEGNGFGSIERLKDQFLDESGNVAVAHHTEAVELLRACADSAGLEDIDADSPSALFYRIGCKPAADRGTRRRAIDEVEAPVVLGALDDTPHYQSVGEVSVAVGAHSVGGVEAIVLVAIECKCLLAVVKANHVGAAQIGCGTDFDPA